MPLFAAIADMQARFEERDLIQLTDIEGTGAIDEGRLEQVLTSADALIIGYIAARYQDVPTFAGQAILKDAACDYAFSLLWRTDIPDWVTARRKGAIETLRRIADGTIKLDQGAEQAVARDGAILISGPDRNFSRDSLANY